MRTEVVITYWLVGPIAFLRGGDGRDRSLAGMMIGRKTDVIR
jgi:hypothetical protein